MKKGIIVIILLVILIIACTPQQPVIQVNNKPYGEQQTTQAVKEQVKEEPKIEVAQEEVKIETPAYTEGKIVSNVTSEASSETKMEEIFASHQPYFCTYHLQDPSTKRISATEIWVDTNGEYRTRSEISETESYILSSLFDDNIYYYWDSQTELGNKYTASEAKSKNLVVKETIIKDATQVKCRKISSVPAIQFKVPSNIKIS
ncbi:MAG: hypothetical protein QW331_00765 [Candidatus Woesearchaeota archaeon]